MAGLLHDDSGQSINGRPPNVSPQEQAAYDQFVSNGYHLIYAGGKVNPQILQRLASPNPVHALAQVTVMILQRLVDSAQQAGKPTDPDIILQGGQEILADLAHVAQTAKIHTYSQQEIEAAVYQAADLFRAMMAQSGKLNPQAAQQDMAALKQSPQMIDQLAPGTTQRFARQVQKMPPKRKGLLSGAAPVMQAAQQARPVPPPQTPPAVQGVQQAGTAPPPPARPMVKPAMGQVRPKRRRY